MFYTFEVRTVSGTVAQSTHAHPDAARMIRKALHTASTLDARALILLQVVSRTGERRTVSRRRFYPSTMSARDVQYMIGDAISFIDNQYDSSWCPPFGPFVRDTLYGLTARAMCVPYDLRGLLLDMIADAAALYPNALKEV